MKKISILGLLAAALVSGAFKFISELPSNTSYTEDPKPGVSIYRNKDGSAKRIDAVFSNLLTFDSLVNMKNVLNKNGITLTYERIRFDTKGGLTQIECEVNCHDGFSGGFSSDSLTIEKWTGFSRDYSEKSKAPFCAGHCVKSKKPD